MIDKPYEEGGDRINLRCFKLSINQAIKRQEVLRFQRERVRVLHSLDIHAKVKTFLPFHR
jgi:hypothetical protein